MPPKPNFTAWFVMQGYLAAQHRPELRNEASEALLSLYQPLADAAARTRFVSQLICALPFGLQYQIGELVTNRGRLAHFVFRKREIESQARALLLSQPIRQVVVLGAGLDLLSMRLSAEYPSVRFFEIDTEESQAFKQEALRGRVPANVSFVCGDLRNPLASILSPATGYDASARTLWIAEGFFMFIPEASVTRLLGDIKAHCAAGSSLLFTTIPTIQISSKAGYILQNLYLQKEKSPILWAELSNNIPLFMNKIGFEVVVQVPCSELHKKYTGKKFSGNSHFAEDIHIAINRNV